MDSAVIDVEQTAPAETAGVGIKTVNLALQGGGAHGAFTWGVLDRLLEEPRFRFEGISGTSAGAINGALLAYGLIQGGREQARELLERFWGRVANNGALSPLQPTWLSRMTGNPHLEASPLYAGFDLLIRVMSPYQFNPAGFNPLGEMLRGLIDFNVLREAQDIRLYINATNVRRGTLKVFSGPELSVEAVLASTCLPFFFQAVEISGEYYWDGGYMGNPPVYPLVHNCQAQDIVIVQLTPIGRDTIPMNPTAIVDRMNEISFNSTFMRELRGLGLINKLLAEGVIAEGTYGLRSMYLHCIGDEMHMKKYGVSSKVNVDWGFMTHLRDLGRNAADRWLGDHFDRVGQASSFDAGTLFTP
jgi:NTE family protein